MKRNSLQASKVVVVAEPLHPDGMRSLEDSEFEVVDATSLPRSSLLDVLAPAAGLIIRSSTVVDRDLLARAPRLRVVARAGVGLDHVDTAAAENSGVRVLNTPDANSVAAAEHTVGLLLATVRHIAAADQELKNSQWRRAEHVGFELCEKCLGIIGLGRIGGRVARMLGAFGMRVIAHDPYISEEAFEERGARQVRELAELLRASEVLTIHTPLNQETRGLIGEPELALLPPGAVVINCARGGLVDERALWRALETGRVAAAGFDVFTDEPLGDRLPADHPAQLLAHHPRVVATPHLGASTREAQRRMSIDVAEVVISALRETAERTRR